MFHKFYSPVKNEDVYIFAEIVKKKKKKQVEKNFPLQVSFPGVSLWVEQMARIRSQACKWEITPEWWQTQSTLPTPALFIHSTSHEAPGTLPGDHRFPFMTPGLLCREAAAWNPGIQDPPWGSGLCWGWRRWVSDGRLSCQRGRPCSCRLPSFAS